MDFENEIVELKRRVGDLEGAMNVLAGRLGSLRPELLAQGEASTRRFDSVDASIDRIVTRLDTVNAQVWSLRDDLPAMLANAVRRQAE